MSTDKNVKLIPLSQDRTAVVDAYLYDELSQYKWYAMASGNNYYATRNTVVDYTGTLVLMHRQIMNAPSNQTVKHINGNSLDNRRNNLRLIHADNGTVNSY